ncbi:lactoylglutathione lyase [Sphingobium sp. AP50]|uniref:VOC family protein n=1 Tax=Sphingobium sp. AP50 TaxID=1884369 RepID=UPI0008B42417|nr:VOC family protein [Sphingobium sp. AP50]SEJ95492.1 lactoylglutathione lyase [Sphingobium sp. AP50]
MAKIIHSMVRVTNERESVDFYKAALDLDVAGRFPFEDFTLVYLRSPDNDFELELTINHGRAEPYALGEGYGHIAVVSDDLEAEHARMERAGLSPQPIKEFKDERLPARFFFISDPDGYKIEVLQRGGRYQ